MKRLKIINVVGTRPNFIKIAPIIWSMEKKKGQVDYLLVHTGQHYDKEMYGNFFSQLNIPNPDINLEVGSDTHAKQTANIMIKFDDVLLKHKPDIVLVVGDVNSTIACALVSVKLGIRVAHVEAGLRSFDRSMPEEINRILTDAISEYLFTTEKSANENLKKEGIPEKKIFFVGNIMIDTLIHCLKQIKDDELPFSNLKKKNYGIITIHRPSNVDNISTLSNFLDIFIEISQRLTLIIPLHPRTYKNIKKFKLEHKLNVLSKNAIISNSIGYIEMIKLIKNAKLVITDSGGLQEETTFLGIPCITIRKNTERPCTVEIGTNVIAGTNRDIIMKHVEDILLNRFKKGDIPPLWDGKTAERILNILINN